MQIRTLIRFRFSKTFSPINRSYEEFNAFSNTWSIKASEDSCYYKIFMLFADSNELF